MTAACALRHLTHLVNAGAVFKLGDPFPGVFLTVAEEDVGSVDLIAAAVHLLSVRNIRVNSHVKPKNLIALVFEVLVVDHGRPDTMQLGRNLEPAKLTAVLPSPLATRVVEVDGGVLDLRAVGGGVVPRVVALIELVVDCRSE